MSEEAGRGGEGGGYYPGRYHERRQYERRCSGDRRGTLRWDPRAAEKERRSGGDRRRSGAAYTRQ